MAFRNQNLLLGTTYNIMASALSQDPRCLEQIEEEKAGKISVLSGENLESPGKVNGKGKAFRYLSIVISISVGTDEYGCIYRECETHLLLVGICPSTPARGRNKKTKKKKLVQNAVVTVLSGVCCPGVLQHCSHFNWESVLVFLCCCILCGQARRSHSTCMHSGRTNLGNMILRECLHISWTFLSFFMLSDYLIS